MIGQSPTVKWCGTEQCGNYAKATPAEEDPWTGFSFVAKVKSFCPRLASLRPLLVRGLHASYGGGTP